MRTFIILLVSALICGLTSAADTKDQQKLLQLDSPAQNKTVHKRGIYPFGYGHSYALPPQYAAFNQFAYQRPAWAAHHKALHTPYLPVHYGHSHPIAHASIGGIPYTLSHGGASVTSYSANYPRYPIVHQKPHHLHYNPHLVRPLAPAYTPFAQVAPVAPVAPVAAPPFIPQHSFFIPHQKPFIPQLSPQFFIPSPQKPIIPIAVSGQNPDAYLPKPVLSPQNPIFGFGASIQPQFVQVQIPTTPSQATPTVPTTITTPIIPTKPAQQPLPIFTVPSTTLFPATTPQTAITTTLSSQQPWRPVIGQPIPSTPASIHRPAISLLPPYYTGVQPGANQFNGIGFNPAVHHHFNQQGPQNPIAVFPSRNPLDNQDFANQFGNGQNEQNGFSNNLNFDHGQTPNQNNNFNPPQFGNHNQNFNGQNFNGIAQNVEQGLYSGPSSYDAPIHHQQSDSNSQQQLQEQDQHQPLQQPHGGYAY